MTLEAWLAFAAALMLLGLSPGPAFAAVMVTAMSRGWPAALAMALGVGLGDVVFLLFAVFGLAAFAALLGEFFALVKLAGAAYLIYLGVRLWRHPPDLAMTAPGQVGGEAARRRRLGPFLGGFALTMGNPKAIGFYLGFLPVFMDLTALTAGAVGLAAGTAFTIIAGSLAVQAALATQVRRFFAQARPRRIFGRLLGTALVAGGIAVASR
ncbi:MAG TPA: LysE family translocator [Kiloniellaceae bacterium]|nr:LysE family translocator [Kiloniellaceae bacterium]